MRRRSARVWMTRIPIASVVSVVYVFLLAPLVVVAVGSLEGRTSAVFHFPPEQLSLAHYWAIPARYFQTLATSLLVATVAAAVGCLVGIPAALGLVRGRWPCEEFIAALFRLPLQIPFVVTGVAFLQLYYLASDFGLRLAGTFLGLVLAHMFLATSYVVGTVGAVLLRFNVHFEEAALSLGASRWATFRQVTLPLIMPGVYAGALYAFIVSFGDIPVALFLAGPKYTTFPVEIFHAIQFDFHPAMLSISTLIILFSLVVLWFIQWLTGLDTLLRAGGRD